MRYFLPPTRLFICISVATAFTFSPSWAQHLAYDNFANWPLVKLHSGVIVCSDYQSDQESFIENFDDDSLFTARWDRQAGTNPLQDAFHGSECENIFLPANVELVPVSPGNADKTLHLTARLEPAAVSLTGFNNGPNGWPCLPPGVQNITTVYTGAAIHLKDTYVFNLGKYEIQCKFPRKDNVWSAFWMWHHDEIDIFDIAYYGKFSQNVFHKDQTASLRDSPCCSHFEHCDFCDDVTDHVDCSKFEQCGDCNEQNPQEVSYGCTYLADGNWHTIGCEWTPYKVRFYVDGITTGTLYRYYYPDKRPLMLECGSPIPEGVFRENPTFPDIRERYFQPIVWIVSEGNNECPDGGQCVHPEDLPATLEVKHLSIRERAYQEVTLSGCYDLCQQGNICQQLAVKNLNGLFGSVGPLQHIAALPTPELSDCQVISTSTGKGTATKCGLDEICFDYNLNGCEQDSCVGLSFTLEYPAPFNDVSFTKWLTSQAPVAYSAFADPYLTIPGDPVINPSACVYVDPGTYCSVNVASNGEQAEASYAAGLTCFPVAAPCATVDLLYDHCGELKSESRKMQVSEGLLKTMLTPCIKSAGTSNAVAEGLNYITDPDFTLCYRYPELVLLQVRINGTEQPLTSADPCIEINATQQTTTVEITVQAAQCGVFTQQYTFVNYGRHYRIAPNPTHGIVQLQIDAPPVDHQLNSDKNLPQPDRLQVYDFTARLLREIDISGGPTTFYIDLTDWPSGIYYCSIKDKGRSAPFNFSVQKF